MIFHLSKDAHQYTNAVNAAAELQPEKQLKGMNQRLKEYLGARATSGQLYMAAAGTLRVTIISWTLRHHTMEMTLLPLPI